MSCHNNETSKIMATCWSLSAEINSSGLMALEGATDHEDKINKNTWLKHNERVSHYPIIPHLCPRQNGEVCPLCGPERTIL